MITEFIVATIWNIRTQFYKQLLNNTTVNLIFRIQVWNSNLGFIKSQFCDFFEHEFPFSKEVSAGPPQIWVKFKVVQTSVIVNVSMKHCFAVVIVVSLLIDYSIGNPPQRITQIPGLQTHKSTWQFFDLSFCLS